MFENNVMEKVFPENLYYDATGCELDTAPGDYYATLMYAVYRFPRYKADIMLMRYRDGLSYRAIGEKCNLSGARVEAIVSECIEKLQMQKQLLTMGVEEAVKVADESKKALLDKLQMVDSIDLSNDSRAYSIFESISIDELDLTARSYNGLANEGLSNVADIIRKGNDIVQIPRLGQKSLSEIIAKLYGIGVDVKKHFNRAIIALNLDCILR